jgi:hypothetical protein
LAPGACIRRQRALDLLEHSPFLAGFAGGAPRLGLPLAAGARFAARALIAAPAPSAGARQWLEVAGVGWVLAVLLTCSRLCKLDTSCFKDGWHLPGVWRMHQLLVRHNTREATLESDMCGRIVRIRAVTVYGVGFNPNHPVAQRLMVHSPGGGSLVFYIILFVGVTAAQRSFGTEVPSR